MYYSEGISMGNLAVVAGKVPKELKEKAKKLGININLSLIHI